jgi:hypothetical protein
VRRAAELRVAAEDALVALRRVPLALEVHEARTPLSN